MNIDPKYCTDCKWSTHTLFCSDSPMCSHKKHRLDRTYSHKQTDKERYPFCNHKNSYGSCEQWEPKKNLGRDIIIIVSKWWESFRS
jgi:hypothetical protein